MGLTMRRVATVAAVALAVSGCGSRLTRAELEAKNGRLAPTATVSTPAAAPQAPGAAAATAPEGGFETAADTGTGAPRALPRQIAGAGAWVGGKLIERLGGSLPDPATPAGFLDALHALKGETLGGLLPPTTYEAGQGHARTNLCIIPVTVRNGKFVALEGDEFTCAPGWKPAGT